MSDPLAFIGLLLTFFGSSLLFFYGLPKKKIGNVFVTADHIEIAEPIGSEAPVPKSEWWPLAQKFQTRARNLNRAGFVLVGVGTALQMIAVYV